MQLHPQNTTVAHGKDDAQYSSTGLQRFFPAQGFTSESTVSRLTHIQGIMWSCQLVPGSFGRLGTVAVASVSATKPFLSPQLASQSRSSNMGSTVFVEGKCGHQTRSPVCLYVVQLQLVNEGWSWW